MRSKKCRWDVSEFMGLMDGVSLFAEFPSLEPSLRDLVGRHSEYVLTNTDVLNTRWEQPVRGRLNRIAGNFTTL